jgi:hypothetical protein
MSQKENLNTIENENFFLEGRLTAPEVYVDGMSHIAIFGGMTKMLLHSIIVPKAGATREIRRGALHLSMSTVSALEMAHFILKAAKSSEPHILNSLDPENAARIKRILDTVSPNASEDLTRKSGSIARDAATGAFISPAKVSPPKITKNKR